MSLFLALSALVSHPLDPAVMDGLNRQSVTATFHGKSISCDGVPLWAVVDRLNMPQDQDNHTRDLTRGVVFYAKDGYAVLIGLSDIDPKTGGTPAFLVDRCDGVALNAETGPLRLIFPNDKRGARSIFQVERVEYVETRAR